MKSCEIANKSGCGNCHLIGSPGSTTPALPHCRLIQRSGTRGSAHVFGSTPFNDQPHFDQFGLQLTNLVLLNLLLLIEKFGRQAPQSFFPLSKLGFDLSKRPVTARRFAAIKLMAVKMRTHA